jgi:hypothetical protein
MIRTLIWAIMSSLLYPLSYSLNLCGQRICTSIYWAWARYVTITSIRVNLSLLFFFDVISMKLRRKNKQTVKQKKNNRQLSPMLWGGEGSLFILFYVYIYFFTSIYTYVIFVLLIEYLYILRFIYTVS